MCGRFVVAGNSADAASFFDVRETVEAAPDIPPSYNVAPTDPVALVIERPDGQRELTVARWGLVPSWSKDPRKGPPLINARIETLLDKPSFRKAAVKRRGMVAANGYYEWQKTPGGKTPVYLHPEDEGLLAFGALYEYWPDPALPEGHPEKWLRSCTIITTAATDTLGHIHDRTPLVIPSDLHADWLDCGTTAPTAVQQLLDSVPEPHLVPRMVSTRVNSVRNDGPELIEPVDHPRTSRVDLIEHNFDY